MEQLALALEGCGGIAFRLLPRRPARPLLDYIDCYFGEEATPANCANLYSSHRLILLPLGCVEMHFSYRDAAFQILTHDKLRRHRSLIVGGHNIRTHHVVENIGPVVGQLHARFKPGGFFGLFGIRESELRNSCRSAKDIFGRGAEKLEESLNGSGSDEERIDCIDNFFIQNMRPAKQDKGVTESIAAAELILEHGGNIKIKRLLAQVDMAKRTFQRRFMDCIGLSPKEFARVARFQKVLDRIALSKSVDWQELVTSCGYYDQSHLIDEFKSATTLSPDFFLREKGRTVIRYKSGLLIREPLRGKPAPPPIDHDSGVRSSVQSFRDRPDKPEGKSEKNPGSR